MQNKIKDKIKDRVSHAILSASGSIKWINCPKSLILERFFENTSSIYAYQGTLAHELGELKLKLKLKRIEEIEYEEKEKRIILEYVKAGKDNDIEELKKYTDKYVTFVLGRFKKAKLTCEDAEIYIEQRLDYSNYAPGGFGTSDVLICGYDYIELIDLKYGRGKKVNAIENTQLMLYGLGALELYKEEFDINKVLLTVFQPRLKSTSNYAISTKKLLEWANEVIKPKALNALLGVGNCVYGKHCDDGFCKARPLCKAYIKKHDMLFKYDIKSPDLISHVDLTEIYNKSRPYIEWINMVEKHMLNLAVNDNCQFDNIELSNKNTNRTFKDTKKVYEILEKNGYKPEQFLNMKLSGIGVIEKLLGKDKFETLLGEYIVKPEGAPILKIINK